MVDARKTIEKLKGEADRERTSLYLSRAIMDEFKAHCGDIAPSRVMEELMKEFIENALLQKKASPSWDKIESLRTKVMLLTAEDAEEVEALVETYLKPGKTKKKKA